MELVGYKLVKFADGSVVAQWGGTLGECPGIPNPISLPNGDQVHSPKVGEQYGEYVLVEWRMDAPAVLAPTTDDLLAYAANARYQKETGGITVSGVPIATDRQSQAMITGANAFVLANPAATIKWKSEAGFVTLTADQITGLAIVVGSHVQACFAKEADLSGEIASGAITTAAQIENAFATVTTAYTS